MLKWLRLTIQKEIIKIEYDYYHNYMYKIFQDIYI